MEWLESEDETVRQVRLVTLDREDRLDQQDHKDRRDHEVCTLGCFWSVIEVKVTER